MTEASTAVSCRACRVRCFGIIARCKHVLSLQTASHSWFQACERQEACRNAALELLEALDAFVRVYGDGSRVRDRKGPRKMYERMLALIARISSYIYNCTETGAFGTLFGLQTDFLTVLIRFARQRTLFYRRRTEPISALSANNFGRRFPYSTATCRWTCLVSLRIQVSFLSRTSHSQ